MEQIELDFVNSLLGLKGQVQEFERLENKKRSVVETVMSELTPEKKEELRQSFTERQPTEKNDKRKGKIRVVDSKGKEHEKMFSSRGQEFAMDTFGATKQQRGLSAEDLHQVGMAMKEIVDMTRKAIDMKDDDGTPLFKSVDELEREIFTPLVREGILPENFVLDQYSEVQKLLNAAFKSYKEHNVEAREDELQKESKSAANRYGAGSGLDRFKDTMKHLASAPKRLADKVGIDENARKWIEFGAKAGVTVKDLLSAGFAVEKMATINPETGQPMLVDRYEKWLNPDPQDGKSADELRVLQEQERRAAKVEKFCKFMGASSKTQTDITNLLSIPDTDGYFYTTEAIDIVLNQLILQGVDFAVEGKAMDDLRNALKSPRHDSKKLMAAQAAAREIDKLLVAHLNTTIRQGAGDAVAGIYYASLDMQGLSDAVARTDPDHAEVLGILASGFLLTLDELDRTLLELGGSIAEGFVKTANGKALVKALEEEPKGAFSQVIAAADTTIASELKNVTPEAIDAINKSVLRKIVSGDFVGALDARIAKVVAVHSKEAGEAFVGLVEKHFDIIGLVDAAAVPNVPELGKLIATDIETAFIFASPNPEDGIFRAAGQAINNGVINAVSKQAGKFKDELANDPNTVFRTLVEVVIAEVESSIKAQGDFIRQLKEDKTVKALFGKSVDSEEIMEELEKADEELAEYERQLVLIDEGGIAAADLKSIEKLMAEMQKDQQTIELVLMVGGAITGFGTSGVGLANWARNDFGDVVAGQILGPLKAAKLILKLAVNLKKAAERIRLFNTFLANNTRAMKAASSLTSAISGFAERKSTQIAFRAIEDALLIVEIASTILGSVPEPFTMAIGKTMGLVTKAAQGVSEGSEFLFTEKKLAEAWKTTMAALNDTRNRALGLSALRLNPTLAMHAIAWAAMKKQPPDPIARIALSDLGLNEQTLAVSGSERKVREYLAIKLSEDGEMIDPDLVAPQWAPKSVKLNREDWYLVTLRAKGEAVPKLTETTEAAILKALQPLENHTADAWAKDAALGKVPPAVLEKSLSEALNLRNLLRAYSPTSRDGGKHEEMDSLGIMFSKQANDYATRLQEIVDHNRQKRAANIQFTKVDIEKQLEILKNCREETDLDIIDKSAEDAGILVLLVQANRLDTQESITKLYGSLVAEVKELKSDLNMMREWNSLTPSFKIGINSTWHVLKKELNLDLPELEKSLENYQEKFKELRTDPNNIDALDQAFTELDQVINKTISENKGLPALRLYLTKVRKAAKVELR